MSSKIVINILSHADEDAVVSEQFGMGDSVPAPPSSDDMDTASAGAAHTQMAEGSDDAPAPPWDSADQGSDLGFDKSEAGPPDLSGDMSKSTSDTHLSGDAPAPPQNHPDIAGDDSVKSAGSTGPPSPPEGDAEKDDKADNKKGKKGSGGKKKK